MTTKKLQNLAAIALSNVEKVKILKLWNSSMAQRQVQRFSIGPFTDSAFNTYLHKYVFWAQMKRAAMDIIWPMTGPEIRTRTPPSTVYIETNQIEQWDYAFNEPVEKKEIQKGFEVKRQLHPGLSMRAFVCLVRLSFPSVTSDKVHVSPIRINVLLTLDRVNLDLLCPWWLPHWMVRVVAGTYGWLRGAYAYFQGAYACPRGANVCARGAHSCLRGTYGFNMLLQKLTHTLV
jgi:hypothetical protein